MTTGGGGASFSSTINSEANDAGSASAARGLTIANTDGAVSVTGAIGAGSNGTLGALVIGTAEADGNTGNITLSNSIGSDSAAGAASISIGNSRTGTLALAGADYNSTGSQMFESDDFDLSGTAITFTSANGGGTDTIDFLDGAGGQIILADGSNLTINSGGAAVTIKPSIGGTTGGTSEDVVINAGSGTISLDYAGVAIGGGHIGHVDLTGGTINLNGGITTTSTASDGSTTTEIDINGAVVLEANTTITSNGGNLDFNTTINSDATARNLTITTGAGSVGIGGNIGGTTTTDLAAIKINETAGTGAITLSGNIGTTSVFGATTIEIGNANTSS